MDGVALEGVDGSVVLALLVTEAPDALGLLVTVLAVDGVTLLSADQEFVWMRILVVVKARTTVDLSFGIVGVAEN